MLTMQKLGIQLSMLTGDTASVAETIRKEVGEISVHSQLFQEDKVRIIDELKKEKGITAMVGDGINDAPALAAAHVGITMGVAGSAVAMETSDIALISNDIRKIAQAVKLGRKSLREIYANVVISLITKAVIIVLAFAGHASLWVAVVADMGTSLLVIFNSMLLLTYTPLSHNQLNRAPADQISDSHDLPPVANTPNAVRCCCKAGICSGNESAVEIRSPLLQQIRCNDPEC